MSALYTVRFWFIHAEKNTIKTTLIQGVDYDDEDDEYFKKKNKKFQRSQSPDLDYLDESDQVSDESSDEETKNMNEKVKELLSQEGKEADSDESSTEDEDSDNEQVESDEDDEEKKDFMAQIKKISKDASSSQNDSGNYGLCEYSMFF